MTQPAHRVSENTATTAPPGGLRLAASVLFAALVSACQFNEALLYVEPTPSGEAIPMVRPAAETAPVVSKEDAADDAVVLVAANGEGAWIAAADKKFGLRMYTLEGDEISNFAVGRINNIDGVRLDTDRYLLAASNRTSKAIELFSVTLTGGEPRVQIEPSIALTLEEPYGLCMAAFDGGVRVFVGDKDGRVEQWRIDPGLNGTLERSHAFESQTEGCVVDAGTGVLYVGEETLGIWAVDLDSGTRRLVDRVGDGRLVADVEGLDIYRATSGDIRYLLASSQGNNAYAVYALPSITPLAQFRIGPNDEAGVDGASETDGIALSATALPGYPKGILVVQDGHNVSPPENQNFKIVDWREIEKLLLLR